jgi:GTP-binding protein HflX
VQVELAQYEYRLPRLTRAWTHLARQAGGRAGGASGGVGVRGPGETQLEADRREIGRRIAFLKRQLEDIAKHREQYRTQRRELAAPVVAVVGYTNAGKSTLLNVIARADVLAEDKLFATLDPTTRRVVLPSDRLALFSDTVGFIQKLPTQLVAAFRSTLEEVTEADLLVHVVDLSHPNMEEQVSAVEEVLDELGAGDKPVVMALNKADRYDLDDVAQAEHVASIQAEYPQSVVMSALTGQGLDDLLEAIDRALKHHMAYVDVLIPYGRGELVSLMHEHGVVESEEHTEHGTHLQGRLPIALAGRFAHFWHREEAS